MWGIVACNILLATSLFLRHQDIEKVTGAQSLEASYHVLLTVTALNESGLTNHWYLPTVSLGKERDKFIPWGGAVPTNTGDYIYTSFTSPGFLAPYFWFKVLNQEPSIKNLAYFNFFIGAACALALFILLLNLFALNGQRGWAPVGAALLACTIAIFSREALHSHGIVYWSQSLYQLILIVSIYFLFKYLTTQNRKNIYGAAVVALAFIGPLTEWTGYVFNAGLILLFFANKKNGHREIAWQIILITAAAGMFTLLHFGLAIGFEPAIKAFLGRFLERSVSTGSTVDLLRGYALSYGLFLPVILTVLVLNRVDIFNRPAASEKQHAIQVTQFIFIASCIPLLENILMLQHATQFSFDRLKFIIPASIILGLAFLAFKTKGRIIFIIIIFFACINGWKSYKNDLKDYAEWATIDVNNRSLVAKLKEKYDFECSVFSSQKSVRGYANLLFHHGIYESKSSQDAEQLISKRNACANIHIQGNSKYTDLPEYTGATVTRPDGSLETIRIENIK